MDARVDTRQVMRNHSDLMLLIRLLSKPFVPSTWQLNGQQAAERKTFTDGRCSVCRNCSSNILGKDMCSAKTRGCRMITMEARLVLRFFILPAGVWQHRSWEEKPWNRSTWHSVSWIAGLSIPISTGCDDTLALTEMLDWDTRTLLSLNHLLQGLCKRGSVVKKAFLVFPDDSSDHGWLKWKYVVNSKVILCFWNYEANYCCDPTTFSLLYTKSRLCFRCLWNHIFHCRHLFAHHAAVC